VLFATRAARPGQQLVRVHAGANLGASQRERLAQVERLAQLLHAFVSGPDCCGRRRVFQPPGKRLLAGAGLGQRQQLEQRSPAEQVQIGRVQMLIVQKSFARLAGPDPAIFQPRQALVVERHQTGSREPRPDDLVVALQQWDERDHRQYWRPGRDTAANRQDQREHGKGEYRQPRHRNAPVLSLEGLVCGRPPGSAGGVFDESRIGHAPLWLTRHAPGVQICISTKYIMY